MLRYLETIFCGYQSPGVSGKSGLSGLKGSQGAKYEKNGRQKGTNHEKRINAYRNTVRS